MGLKTKPFSLPHVAQVKGEGKRSGDMFECLQLFRMLKRWPVWHDDGRPSVPGPQPRAWHVLIRPSPLLVLVMVTGGNYPVSGYNQGNAGSSVGWLNFYIDPHNVQRTSIHRKLGCLSTNIFTDRQLVVEQHGLRDKHPNVWITCLFKHSFSKDP